MHALELDVPVPYVPTWLGLLYLDGCPRPYDTPDQEGPPVLPPPPPEREEPEDDQPTPLKPGRARLGSV